MSATQQCFEYLSDKKYLKITIKKKKKIKKAQPGVLYAIRAFDMGSSSDPKCSNTNTFYRKTFIGNSM